MPEQARVSVVVLGYGAEEHLETCLEALTRELGDADSLVLVDNEITDFAVRRKALSSRVEVYEPGHNLGFAGGCNAAADRTSGEVLVFVNSDAIVRPGSLRALADAAADPAVGIAGGCLRLADSPDLVNSVGNPLHYLGVTWAGSCGEPAADHDQPGRVAVATGGFFAVRREVWNRLGGFDPTYFAYHEDTDLSVRALLAGLEVRYVPDAVADHFYEFSRNPRKMYLLERNRLITVLTDYPAPLLWRILPIAVPMEVVFLVLALLQGWPRQKLASWGWLIRHARYLSRRRARVQSAVTVADPDRALAHMLTDKITPPMVDSPPGTGVLNAALAGYWRLVGARWRDRSR